MCYNSTVVIFVFAPFGELFSLYVLEYINSKSFQAVACDTHHNISFCEEFKPYILLITVNIVIGISEESRLYPLKQYPEPALNKSSFFLLFVGQ